MREHSLTWREKRARIPRLPNFPIVYDPPDRGAPLPEVNWDNRFTVVRTGTNPDGTPILELRRKPRST